MDTLHRSGGAVGKKNLAGIATKLGKYMPPSVSSLMPPTTSKPRFWRRREVAPQRRLKRGGRGWLQASIRCHSWRRRRSRQELPEGLAARVRSFQGGLPSQVFVRRGDVSGHH